MTLFFSVLAVDFDDEVEAPRLAASSSLSCENVLMIQSLDDSADVLMSIHFLRSSQALDPARLIFSNPAALPTQISQLIFASTVEPLASF